MSKFLRSTFSLATLSVLSLAFGAESAVAGHGSSGGSNGGSSGGSNGGSSGGTVVHGSSGGKHGSSGGKHGHKAKKKKHGSSGGSSGAGGSSGGAGGSSGGYGGGSSGYATASYVAPSVASPQMVAYLNVNVPADAKVYLQGQLMTLDGAQRRYYTPAIEQGQQKSYDVKVEVARGGKTLSKTAQAVVAAGQEAEISVAFDEKNPADLVATVKLASGR